MPVSATAADMAQGWASGLVWPRDGRDEESWQRTVLAEQLRAFGVPEAPTEDELCGYVPDPDSDPPGDAEAGVPAQVWATWAAEAVAPPPSPHPTAPSVSDASRGDRGPRGTPPTARGPGPVPSGPGEDGEPGTPGPLRALAGFGAGGALDVLEPGAVLAGFGAGGTLDVLEPGAALAGCVASAWAGGLSGPSDDELIGMVRAWRRLCSWAAAGEFAAVAELVARRSDEHVSGLGCQPVDDAAGELACALALTRRGADVLVDRALRLAELPGTAAALRLGRIDVPKTLAITDGVAGLDSRLGRAVEDLVLAKAATQTTGELRAAVRHAVMAADPAGAQARRENAEKDARVELWDEPAGTKALAGRDLPPAEVLAADKRISAIARKLKAAGAAGSLDVLRAKVYLALLAGQPLDRLLPTPTDADGADSAEATDAAHADSADTAAGAADSAADADSADTAHTAASGQCGRCGRRGHRGQRRRRGGHRSYGRRGQCGTCGRRGHRPRGLRSQYGRCGWRCPHSRDGRLRRNGGRSLPGRTGLADRFSQSDRPAGHAARAGRITR